MSISSILSSGMQGLQAGIDRTSVASTALNSQSEDFAAKMVALRQGEIDAKIAADVIKTGDQILGTIINIRG